MSTMQFTTGASVLFAGALPNNDTVGRVVRQEGDHLTILTRTGALIQEHVAYCKPYSPSPLTLGDLRRMTENLPDDTMLFVDGQYRTSAMTATYDSWEVKNPDTGDVTQRYSISLTHTMTNVPLKETDDD